MAARNARNQEFITWNCNQEDVEENLHKRNQSSLLDIMEIPFQWSFPIGQIVCVENNELGEKVGSPPCHFRPNHPTPIVTDQHNLHRKVCNCGLKCFTVYLSAIWQVKMIHELKQGSCMSSKIILSPVNPSVIGKV